MMDVATDVVGDWLSWRGGAQWDLRNPQKDFEPNDNAPISLILAWRHIQHGTHDLHTPR
ncbi:unnamed protein product [Amoebophrya sp. A25]|nr:unnamed protein product [Amoebophrya sp. A25]|eukprot:GSA25T00005329001.1